MPTVSKFMRVTRGGSEDYNMSVVLNDYREDHRKAKLFNSLVEAEVDRAMTDCGYHDKGIIEFVLTGERDFSTLVDVKFYPFIHKEYEATCKLAMLVVAYGTNPNGQPIYKK